MSPRGQWLVTQPMSKGERLLSGSLSSHVLWAGSVPGEAAAPLCARERPGRHPLSVSEGKPRGETRRWPSGHSSAFQMLLWASRWRCRQPRTSNDIAAHTASHMHATWAAGGVGSTCRYGWASGGAPGCPGRCSPDTSLLGIVKRMLKAPGASVSSSRKWGHS